VSARKFLKIALLVSVVLYAVFAGMFALMRSTEFFHGLSTAETLYGPAIIIASAWILWAIIHAGFGRKRHDVEQRSKNEQSGSKK